MLLRCRVGHAPASYSLASTFSFLIDGLKNLKPAHLDLPLSPCLECWPLPPRKALISYTSCPPCFVFFSYTLTLGPSSESMAPESLYVLLNLDRTLLWRGNLTYIGHTSRVLCPLASCWVQSVGGTGRRPEGAKAVPTSICSPNCFPFRSFQIDCICLLT